MRRGRVPGTAPRGPVPGTPPRGPVLGNLPRGPVLSTPPCNAIHTSTSLPQMFVFRMKTLSKSLN